MFLCLSAHVSVSPLCPSHCLLWPHLASPASHGLNLELRTRYLGIWYLHLINLSRSNHIIAATQHSLFVLNTQELFVKLMLRYLRNSEKISILLSRHQISTMCIVCINATIYCNQIHLTKFISRLLHMQLDQLRAELSNVQSQIHASHNQPPGTYNLQELVFGEANHKQRLTEAGKFNPGL